MEIFKDILWWFKLLETVKKIRKEGDILKKKKKVEKACSGY